MSMKPEIKKLWLAALRGGEYTQGALALAQPVYADDEDYPDEDYPEVIGYRFCCLGVLCEVAIKNGLDLEVSTDRSGERRYGPQRAGSTLPTLVIKWAGLEEFAGDTNGRLDVDGQYNVRIDGPLSDGRDHVYLSAENDGGQSFAEIADLIEKYL